MKMEAQHIKTYRIGVSVVVHQVNLSLEMLASSICIPYHVLILVLLFLSSSHILLLKGYI